MRLFLVLVLLMSMPAWANRSGGVIYGDDSLGFPSRGERRDRTYGSKGNPALIVLDSEGINDRVNLRAPDESRFPGLSPGEIALYTKLLSALKVSPAYQKLSPELVRVGFDFRPKVAIDAYITQPLSPGGNALWISGPSIGAILKPGILEKVLQKAIVQDAQRRREDERMEAQRQKEKQREAVLLSELSRAVGALSGGSNNRGTKEAQRTLSGKPNVESACQDCHFNGSAKATSPH